MLRGLWLPFVVAVGSGGFMVRHVLLTPPSYISLAKLVAGGHMRVGASNVGYQENLKDFYGTIIETLESSGMRRHALERVRILNPDLREADVEVRVSQNKGSAIFNVAVVGADKDYVKTFLNALLDSFREFREQNREQQRNKAVQALAEDVAKSEKTVKAAAGRLADLKKSGNMILLAAEQAEQAEALKALMSEKRALLAAAGGANLSEAERSAKQQRVPIVDRELVAVKHEIIDTSGRLAEYQRIEKDLELAEKGHAAIFELMHKFTVGEDTQGDYVSVMERASTAVEDVHSAAVPAIFAGIGGFVGGWVVLLAGAVLWVAAGPRRDRVPPLPSA